jgi:hypothetical protein
MAGKKRGTTLAVGHPGPRSIKSDTTKPSSISGMDSAPLSDPYVAVHLPTDDRKGAVVKEPEGSAQFSVPLPRRSTRLRAAPPDPPQLLNPHKIFSKTAPDGKRKPGWQYEIEASGNSGTPAPEKPDVSKGPPGYADGSRDIVELQAGSKVRMDGTGVGRKRAATSDAPGADSRGKGKGIDRLASSKDFPSHHWEEEVSVDLDNTDWPPLGTPKNHTSPGSPMKTSPAKHDDSPMATEVSGKGKTGTAITPTSSPISRNPLLAKIPRFNHAPNAAWLHAQGLIPASSGLLAPGYIPAINADPRLRAPGQARPKAPSMSRTDIRPSAPTGLPHGTASAERSTALDFGNAYAANDRAPAQTSGLNTRTYAGHRSIRQSKCFWLSSPYDY